MSWTKEQYRRFMANQPGLEKVVDSSVAKVEAENSLHNDILAECSRRGWIPFHGSMAHKTFRTPGEPDFVIIAEFPRVILVECKSKTGKLSTDQLAIKAWARKLGHEVHTISNFQQFLELIHK